MWELRQMRSVGSSRSACCRMPTRTRTETIADLLGYESEAAFRKAFKREIGIPPAQYRKGGSSG